MKYLSEGDIIRKLGLSNINIVVFDGKKVVSLISKDKDIDLDESGEDNLSYLFDLVYLFNTAIKDKSSRHKKEIASYLRDVQKIIQ